MSDVEKLATSCGCCRIPRATELICSLPRLPWCWRGGWIKLGRPKCTVICLLEGRNVALMMQYERWQSSMPLHALTLTAIITANTGTGTTILTTTLRDQYMSHRGQLP